MVGWIGLLGCSQWLMTVATAQVMYMTMTSQHMETSSNTLSIYYMMMSSNGKIFCVTGPLCREAPVNSTLRHQWCWALMFSLICAWTNDWVNNWDAGDLRLHSTHYDTIVMAFSAFSDEQQCRHHKPTKPNNTSFNWKLGQNVQEDLMKYHDNFRVHAVECHYTVVKYCNILHQ